jgi:hypothetical protein
MFFIPNYSCYHSGRFPRKKKGSTATAMRKGIPHNNVDLPLLVSIKAIGLYVPIANGEVLLAADYVTMPCLE